MSYLNQAQDPGRRATAIVTVGGVHALLAVGLLTGLTVTFTETIDPPFKATVITPDPVKPEPTPTEQPKQHQQTYVAPPPVPPIDVSTASATAVKPVDTDIVETTYFPTGHVDPPAPPPPPRFTPKRAVPNNGASRWISDRDYPRSALIGGDEGSAGYRLVIGTDGGVSSCEVTRSTGNRALDNATCRLISDRARFDPATDETGAKIVGTYTGSVTWQIPD